MHAPDPSSRFDRRTRFLTTRPAYPNRSRVGNTRRGIALSTGCTTQLEGDNRFRPRSSNSPPRDMLYRTIKGHRYDNDTQNEWGGTGDIIFWTKHLLLSFCRKITRSNVVHYKRVVNKNICSIRIFFFDLRIFLTRVPKAFFHFNLTTVFASLLFSLFGCLTPNIYYISVN